MKPELIIDPDGTKFWYLNRKLHREDGPAIEYSDGSIEWWLNGKLHREDGPAIEFINGTKQWWINNKLHREDGPAIEHPDGTQEWFLNGKQLTEKQLLNEELKINYLELYNSYLIYQIMGS